MLRLFVPHVRGRTNDSQDHPGEQDVEWMVAFAYGTMSQYSDIASRKRLLP